MIVDRPFEPQPTGNEMVWLAGRMDRSRRSAKGVGVDTMDAGDMAAVGKTLAMGSL